MPDYKGRGGSVWDAVTQDFVPLVGTEASGLKISVGGPSSAVVFARINAVAAGNTTLVAAQGAGNRIRVLGYALTSSAAGAVTFQDSAAVIAAGPFDLPINGSVSFAGSALGPAFQLAANVALVINLSVIANVRGHLAYILTT